MPGEGKTKTYLCIDLKCFYASVECAARGMDPFSTNLAVADRSRGRTTICLAISPALKALGVRNRCRLFEIPEGIPLIVARPRMRAYMETSADIYSIYLRYICPDDIHVYSIDECFIDATPYLALYGLDAKGLARLLMGDVLAETGITATAGIGSNLFLAKVALDIGAKHAPDGIGMLDEASFRRTMWRHEPITDFWNIGPGIAARLEKYGARTLYDVARLDESLLYREFGANAEFLIDHAWGQEPCTIAEIQAWKPQGHSMMNGQVLPGDYSFSEARMVLREMVEASALDLVAKGLVAGRVSLFVGYAKKRAGAYSASASDSDSALALASAPPSTSSDTDGASEGSTAGGGACFDGGHGRRPAKGYRSFGHANAGRKLSEPTNSFRALLSAAYALFDEECDRSRSIRRISLGLGDLADERFVQKSLFDDSGADPHERVLQEAMLAVKGKFGKNSLLKGTSYREKATARERNRQIGGHRA